MNRQAAPALVAVLVALAAGSAFAHMVFIAPEEGGQESLVLLSEDLIPDVVPPVDKTRLHLLTADGKSTPLEAKVVEDWLSVPTPGEGPRVVYGSVTYGVMSRGGGDAFKLVYHPKAVIGPADLPAATLGDAAPLEIVARKAEGGVRFVVLAAGKPVPDAEVQVQAPDEGEETFKTDAAGATQVFAKPGRYALWTRLIEETAGELDGKAFKDTRHYATLVVDVTGEAKSE